MARRRMKSKIQPAEMKIALRLPANSTKYVDLSQCASIVNRRFYRQGLNWAVSHFTVYKSTPTAVGDLPVGVVISRLPNTWVMSNAWTKGFKAWQQMIKNATNDAEQQSVVGKFLDFKIFANETHYSEGMNRNLLPRDSSAGEATAGEYLPATIEVPTTNSIPATPGQTREYNIMAVGPNYGVAGTEMVVSLINGYANSRALPSTSDPNVPADNDDTGGFTPENWLAAIFNEGTDQTGGVLEDVSEYDQPPYPFEGDLTHTDTMYPGGQTQLSALTLHDSGYFSSGTNSNKFVLEGGNFPCGLIELFSNADEDVNIVINLVPGSHRGYLAESMLEM